VVGSIAKWGFGLSSTLSFYPGCCIHHFWYRSRRLFGPRAITLNSVATGTGAGFLWNFPYSLGTTGIGTQIWVPNSCAFCRPNRDPIPFMWDEPATKGSEIAMPSWPMIEYPAETWCLLVTHSLLCTRASWVLTHWPGYATWARNNPHTKWFKIRP